MATPSPNRIIIVPCSSVIQTHSSESILDSNNFTHSEMAEYSKVGRFSRLLELLRVRSISSFVLKLFRLGVLA